MCQPAPRLENWPQCDQCITQRKHWLVGRLHCSLTMGQSRRREQLRGRGTIWGCCWHEMGTGTQPEDRSEQCGHLKRLGEQCFYQT